MFKFSYFSYCFNPFVNTNLELSVLFKFKKAQNAILQTFYFFLNSVEFACPYNTTQYFKTGQRMFPN